MQISQGTSTGSQTTQLSAIENTTISLAIRKPNETDKLRVALEITVKLGNILETYKTATDEASKGILSKGGDFIAYIYNNQAQPFDTILKGAVERVNGLRQIFVNPSAPIQGTIFTDPWLVESVVIWEKSTLDYYRECQKYKPENERRTVQADPCELAKQVVDWLGQFEKKHRLLSPFEGSNLQIDRPVNQETNREDNRLEVIYKRIQDGIKFDYIIDEKKKLQVASLKNKELTVMVEFLEEANAQDSKEFRRQLSLQAQGHTQQITEVNRVVNVLVNEKKSNEKFYKERNQENQATIQETRKMVEELTAKAHALQVQLNNTNYQLACTQSQVGQLNHALANADNGSSFCVLM